jgi:hypothetical protein
MDISRIDKIIQYALLIAGELIRTSFLWRGVYLAVSCMSRRFWPQDMGCCMDDPAEGIWQHSFY